jgi:predicted MFS family arabinose efflux permease
VCILLTLKAVKEGKDDRVRKVDVWGAALAAVGLAGITYGLIEGPVNKWQAGSIVPLIVGLASIIIFLWYEARSRDPMVTLSLFRSRNFSIANIMTFAMYGALSGFFFALVIYLQTKMGYSSIKAGISLLPVTLLLLLFSGRVGGLSSKYGPRLFLAFGPILAAIGMISLVDYQPGDSYVTFLLPRVLLFGVGLVLLVAPLTSTVMMAVDDSSSGIASGVNNAVSRVAGLIVIALLGLFGSAHVFRFSIILCALMAGVAGIVSFIGIQNNPRPIKVE